MNTKDRNVQQNSGDIRDRDRNLGNPNPNRRQGDVQQDRDNYTDRQDADIDQGQGDTTDRQDNLSDQRGNVQDKGFTKR